MVWRQWQARTIVLCGAALMLAGAGARVTGESPRSSAPSPSPQVAVKSPPPVNPQLIDANTRFGLKLFTQLAQETPTQNVFISPTSVAMALAMTYNGASGTTQTAMADALELKGLDLPTLNEANAALQTSLEAMEPDVQLAIANSLWGRQDFAFKPDFLQRNREFYHAEIQSLDFGATSAVNTINAWVSENTNGKIERILDRISANDILFLINATYFKGQWSQPFEQSQTQPKPFYLADGTAITHPAMQQQGKYRYLETADFQAVRLPYGKQQRMSFYLFLPKADSSVPAFLQQLTAANWETWMQQFAQRPGEIQLPRFETEYSTDLKTTLSQLGMGVAFDRDRANFDQLSDAQTFISQVKHKTFLEVNEDGTEAAAATAVGISVTSIQLPQEPFRLIADRPFVLAIRDDQTGTLLFLGAIANPQ